MGMANHSRWNQAVLYGTTKAYDEIVHKEGLDHVHPVHPSGVGANLSQTQFEGIQKLRRVEGSRQMRKAVLPKSHPQYPSARAAVGRAFDALAH